MLTEILTIFLQKAIAGIGLITPYALGLYGAILSLDFVWSMTQVALNQGEAIFKTITQKAIRYGIYFFLIHNYKEIVDQIIKSFVKIGLVAGGGSLSEAQATDPSYIIDLGFRLMDKMYSFKDLVQSSGDTSTVLNTIIAAAKGDLTVAKLFPNFFFWLVSLLILAAFTIIAVQLFITWIETYFITTLAIIFIPCGIFKPFAFITEKAIGAILGTSVKLMMLLCIISISFPLLEQWQVTPNPSSYESIKLLTSAAAIAFLCWQAPSLALSLMTGNPSLNGNSILAAAASAANEAARAGNEIINNASNLYDNGGAKATQAAAAAGGGVSENSAKMMETNPKNFDGESSTGGSNITAENISKRLQLADNTVQPESTGSKQESGQNSGNTSHGQSPYSTGSPSGGTSINTANMAGRIDLKNNTIPPEPKV